MARSNSGGTRGFLRGKVANDLYQVTKRADGRKLQLVRAVEESRTNNNTEAQALARMRMALLMGALKDLKQIVDHSWQGIPYGQLSIAHFVEVNMPPLISDCKANWSADNHYCYPVKGVSDMRIGEFVIASGTLATPSAISRGTGYSFGSWYPFTLDLGKASPTFADLKAVLSVNAKDYITLLMLCALYGGDDSIVNQALFFARLYLAEGVDDATVITSSNVGTMFTYEANTQYRVSFASSSHLLKVEVYCEPDGKPRSTQLSSVIVSRWDGRVWCRNNAQFLPDSDIETPNFELLAPRRVFQSWFESYDPGAEDSDVYPLPE